MNLYDQEAEQAVLGSILFDNSVFDEVLDKLKSKDFFIQEHQVIFEKMVELHHEGSSIDEVLIGAKMEKVNGSNSLLWGLVDCSSEIENIGEYITIVSDRSISRQLQTLADEAKIIAGTKNVNEAIAEVLLKVTKLKDSIQKKVEFTHIGDILKNVFEDLQTISETPEEVVGYKTGFTDMDVLTQGLHPKEMFVIAARPSMGKTALAINIATNVAKNHSDMDVLVFSVETYNNQLGSRIISSESKVNSTALRSGNLDQGQWDNLLVHWNKLGKMPLYINDSVSTIEQVVYLSKKHSKKNKISVIVIDYLQLLKTTNNKYSREQEVAEVSRALKMLAKDLDCCVMPLCQLNRDLEKRPDKRPKLSDLRESGCLSGDTQIYEHNHKSFFNIKNLDTDKKIKVGSNSELLTNIISKGSKMFKTGEKEFYEITLSTGHIIKATANHKFLIPGRKWTRLDGLEEGGLVGIHLNSFDTGVTDLNHGELKLLALFIGNGCCLKRRSLQLTMHSEDIDLCEESITLAKNVFNDGLRPYLKHQTYRKGTDSESTAINVFYPSVRVPSRGYRNPLVLFFEKYGLYGKRSKEKEIPGVMFAQSLKSKVLFLRYLWATDGTICFSDGVKKRVGVAYSTSSVKLATQVQLLLQDVGILSTITKTSKENKFINYNISINSRYFISKFLEDIGVAGERKTKIVEYCKEKIATQNPGWTKYELSKEKDIAYVPIKEIKPIGLMDSYDIEVPKTHNFFANGFIVHNSIEQDADVIAFIYRDEVYNENTKKKGIAEIDFAKHKNGETKMIELMFTGKFTRFDNLYKNEYETF